MKTFSDSFKVTAIAIAFAWAWSIEQNDLDIEMQLANEYAAMLDREAACENWECIKQTGENLDFSPP